MNKYKYNIVLFLSIAFVYSILTYFSNAGVPIKIFLVGLITLIFLKDFDSCVDYLHINIPSVAISYILVRFLPNINRELCLIFGFSLFVLLVYIYSYIKKKKILA